MKKFRDLPTPCLILDLDRFDANLDKMSRFVTERGIALRPHSKTHKCAQIAGRQIARGAIGICVATIAEAEVMARNEIRGLLITAELVGQPKLSRFVEVLKRAPDTMLVVDSTEGASELQNVVQQAGMQTAVLIDLDIGQNRTGIKPGEPARELADAIARSPNLRLKGICAYAGRVAVWVLQFQHRADHAVRYKD